MKRLLVSLALLAGAALQPAFSGQKPPVSTEDDRIVDQVRMRLAGDADVKGGALEVSVKDGEVVIKGRVDTEKGKSKATRLAKKVKGVKSVDNELSVGPPV
jgi:hyperosmotically inducible protein